MHLPISMGGDSVWFDDTATPTGKLNVVTEQRSETK
jgi:hypothetical protein